ncbi:MAG: hypothetical protein KGL53_03565 [Elusimicrobia bacterium]|nr:hypothetical protein [Elusimicrobiota bacterium]
MRNETPAAAKNPETLIQNWPERSRLAARALLEKYGRPDIFDENRLAWEGNRPWDETVVRRAAPADVPALTSRDVLEQSISYRVPPGKAAALKSFDGRLVVDRENAVLTSYSASEGLNYLALNLADEIVEGKRSPEEARAFYRRTAELAEAGKSSPYMNGFLFPLSARAAPLE